MKAISYSIFGVGETNPNCFSFESYLRGLHLNLRLNRLIYPDWITVINCDSKTQPFVWDLNNLPNVRVMSHKAAPLCAAMLWRLAPVFEMSGGHWLYSHVICRDVDSPTTYREAQAVQVWINNDKAMHAIADSVSHTIPLMGGMIGVRPDYFTERMNCNTFHDFMQLGKDYNFSAKGTDQDFLNGIVYQRFAQPGHDSITQHYIKGMPQTFLQDYHNTIDDIPLGIPESLKESNEICGHIGAAGFYEPPMFKFLNKYWHKFGDILEIEKKNTDIFWWAK